MTFDDVLGAVGVILTTAAIILLAIILANKWAVAYLARHAQPVVRRPHQPDFFRPARARRRSHW